MSRIFWIHVAVLGIGLLQGASMYADEKPNSPAIEIGRPIGETTAVLRKHRIQWDSRGWATTRGNSDTDEVDFDLNEEMVARIFYSKSDQLVTGINIVVCPKGQGRVAQTFFSAKRIQLEDDGSYLVQYSREPKRTTVRPSRSPKSSP